MTDDVILSEILGGDSLSLPAAAKLIPGRGTAPHIKHTTVWRWVTMGTKTAGDRVVKLEAVRLGSRWLTSKAAVLRFVKSLTAGAHVAEPQPERTDAARRRAAEAAARRLAAAGA